MKEVRRPCSKGKEWRKKNSPVFLSTCVQFASREDTVRVWQTVCDLWQRIWSSFKEDETFAGCRKEVGGAAAGTRPFQWEPSHASRRAAASTAPRWAFVCIERVYLSGKIFRDSSEKSPWHCQIWKKEKESSHCTVFQGQVQPPGSLFFATRIW